MGVMRFLVTPADRITDELVQQAALASLEHVLWQSRNSLDGNQLLLQRTTAESGSLQVPWPVEGRGRLVLSTGTLIERPAPYLLPLELARGTVCQFRNQLAEWQAVGLVVSEAIHQRARLAVQLVAQAAVSQTDLAVSASLAEDAIFATLDAGDLLAAAYVEQVMQVRRRTGSKSPALLGADLGNELLDDTLARGFLSACNAARAPLCWREIEAREGAFQWSISDTQIDWCRARGLKVIGGPLLNFDAPSLPDWLYLWQEDFDSLLEFVEQYVRTTVTRYRGKVDAWICAARINTGDVLGLSEEEKLRLTAQTIELVHSLDPDAGRLVSLDQPWTEYLTRRPMDIPPLNMADALVRSGLNLNGLMLEWNVGYYPSGTLPRTVLEGHRQVDLWSGFGLPLWLSLTVPSSAAADPQAIRQGLTMGDFWTEKHQHLWVARNLPLLLAKSYVAGVLWAQLSDRTRHEFPNGGIFTADGQAKLALRTLAAARQAYIK